LGFIPIGFRLISLNALLRLSAPTAEGKQFKRVGFELRRYVPPFYEQVGPDLWVDQLDGEELSRADLIDRFDIPPKVFLSAQKVYSKRTLNSN